MTIGSIFRSSFNLTATIICDCNSDRKFLLRRNRNVEVFYCPRSLASAAESNVKGGKIKCTCEKAPFLCHVFHASILREQMYRMGQLIRRFPRSIQSDESNSPPTVTLMHRWVVAVRRGAGRKRWRRRRECSGGSGLDR